MNHKIFMWKTTTLRRFAAVTIYAIAMGYLESAAVIYLRQTAFGNSVQVFPVRFLDPQLGGIEFVREAATIIMLLMVGYLPGRSRLQQSMFFVYSFAVWDILYYLFLKIFTGWPRSFGEFDVLFLIPVIWISPVICPILISLLLAVSATILIFLSESTDARNGKGSFKVSLDQHRSLYAWIHNKRLLVYRTDFSYLTSPRPKRLRKFYSNVFQLADILYWIFALVRFGYKDSEGLLLRNDIPTCCGARKKGDAMKNNANDIKIQHARWEKKIDGERLRDYKFTTVSDYPTELLCTPENVKDIDVENDIGLPGEFPYTRGIHETMYRGKLWTMRQFAGFGTPEDSNNRFHYLLENGQTGLSVAFDLPTLMGRDADDPLSEGEVGVCGVAVSSLADMEILFKGIPLDKVSTSMTINAPAAMLLAFYIAVAERKGVRSEFAERDDSKQYLKEYIAQKEWIYPPAPSMRIITDMFAYCAEEMPWWNPISISGYHIREAGSTAIQESG